MKSSKKIFVLLLLELFVSCSKDKFVEEVDNRYNTGASKSSNVRIVNLGGSNQVIVNGDSITNFVIRKGETDPMAGKYPPTKYFPVDGRLGTLWNVPQDLLNKQNSADIEVTYVAYQGIGIGLQKKFKIQDKGNSVDYYTLLGDYYNVGLPEVIEVPRSVESPRNPENCKIRIINFAEKPGESQVTQEAIEDLYGPVSLTWSDGTAINNALSHVPVGKVSDYVEIPYGTYQLKVLTENQRQLPSTGSLTMDYMTSSISYIENRTAVIPTYLTYNPIANFKPGGVYTVVVYSQPFDYPNINDPEYTHNQVQNGFQIIADMDPPVNNTYARIQFVNARAEAGAVSLKVGDKSTEAVGFGSHTAYMPAIHGKLQFQAVLNNTALTAVNYDVKAGDNYTVWLYSTATGKDSLVVSHNNLSGVTFGGQSGTQDATYERFKTNFYTDVRFFNFNKVFPYATFTSDNGKPFSNNGWAFNERSTEQLTPGYIPWVNPYVRLVQMGGNTKIQTQKIMAYHATENTTPGSWADEVAIYTTQDLIAKPELFAVRGALPNADIGSYSIALIGKQTEDPRYKSRMMIVKHTK
ncbi:DUF4397 domain-containing protein [Sphingobacterium sp. DR205]|uniref:DUF4397 domain-containing protein n=1 Tax=Sphingobacterium sp. DR205 TaxID=2713573 RepID=UPI0013E4BFE1|nr:DUF4397 domain-containing protein [Sphingobacterium sp. DR205]QIH34885.1 DUF4397 domain-containing protein [Sphingobacterium sp. DR205]